MKRSLVAWSIRSGFKRDRVLLMMFAIGCSLAEGACGGGTLSGVGVTSRPNVTLSTQSMSFNSQISHVGSVTLTNSGNAALNISGIKISPSFSESDTCIPTVAPGASCVISVTFAPSTTGNFTGTLSISDDAAGGVQTVSLNGVGATGNMTLTGACFGFRNLPIGPPGAGPCAAASSNAPAQCPAGKAAITPAHAEADNIDGDACASSTVDLSVSCRAVDSIGYQLQGWCEAQ
jgi:HYDIN/CFA65/VesB family protein